MGRRFKKSLIKWSLLVLCGCIAYLLGNYFGQRQHLVQIYRHQSITLR